MNSIDILILIIVGSLFLMASYKLYKNSKNSNLGLGCAGCRISDTCQKPEKSLNFVEEYRRDHLKV
ncbi:MAG TPA: hypothetical protein VFC83_00085 [Erysipelotrichaceae bacterium]|nr:hypothetical protein [Erysipelotrichaceae bacterium]